MPSLNRVQIIGRLGKDPEERYLPSGKKYVRFTAAVSDKWRSAEGELKERTDWFNIQVWGRLAETCMQYLHKGQLVYLEGPLRNDRYERNGETHHYTYVFLEGMQMLERKHHEQEHEEPAPAEHAEPEVDFEEFPIE